MDILATIKSLSILKTKARPRSHAPMEHMPIDGCRSGCAMHRIIPKVHDVYLLRHDRRNHESLHEWFLGLWKDLLSLSRKFGLSLAEMPRKGPSAQLGKMSFHDPRRHRLGTLGVRKRDRGGQGEDWSHRVTPASHQRERNPKLSRPCRVLPMIYCQFLSNP